MGFFNRYQNEDREDNNQVVVMQEEEINKLVYDAERYRTGSEGYNLDITEAARLYEKAAKAGNVYSQLVLGYLYDYGEGVVADFEKAEYWYGKASVNGSADASLNWGNMYWSGRTGRREFDEARKHYEKAVEQGNAIAASNLGSMYLDLYQNSDGRISQTEAVKEAAWWIEKAASMGYVRSVHATNLGIGLADIGENEKASEWFVKAVDADTSNPDAQFMLAKHRFFGKGTDMDLTDAKERFDWLVKEFDDKDAKMFLQWYVLYDKVEHAFDLIHDFVKSYRFGNDFSLNVCKYEESGNLLILFHADKSFTTRERVVKKDEWDLYMKELSNMRGFFEVKDDEKKDSFEFFVKDFVFSPEIEDMIISMAKEKLGHFAYTTMTIKENPKWIISWNNF